MFRQLFFVIFTINFFSLINGQISPTTGAEAEIIRQNPKEVFLELIRQRFNGNAVQQCPCVTPPGTDKCVVYDPRYAAISAEEAAVAFSDLTADNFDTSPFRRGDYSCTTEQCIQCAALLFYRLKEINFIPSDYESRFSFDLPSLQELRPLGCKRLWMSRRRRLLAPPTVTPPYVQRLIEQGNQYVNDYARYPSTQYSSKVTNTLNAQNSPTYTPQQSSTGSQTGFQPNSQTGFPSNSLTGFQPNPQTGFPSNTGPFGPNVPPQLPSFPGTPPQFPPPFQQQQPPFGGFPPSAPAPYYPQYPPFVPPGGVPKNNLPPGLVDKLVAEKVAFLSLFGKKRRKRNTHDVSGKNLIGERFVISCVEKGDAESDETDFLNLCTSCWAWRKLPDNYFPQIINELVCQENDFCLSGWGSCTQRYRHVDVLHMQNGSWVPTTVVSGACCDCKIRAGTEVHQLVIGNVQREHRQIDSVLDIALRTTIDQNNPTVKK